MLEQSKSEEHGSPTRAVITAVHFWNWQLVPGPHWLHCWPNVPHAACRLPGWQKPNMQQPLGQVVGPQAWQLPLRQFEPEPQAVHATPLVPQAKLSNPRRQDPLKQQPGQVSGPQLVAEHRPLTHAAPGGQLMHACALVPHALED